MNRPPWTEGDGDELDGNGERTNGEAAMVCERRPVTEKKNVADAQSDGCRDEVAGGRSAGATIAAGQNRRVGSPLLFLHHPVP